MEPESEIDNFHETGQKSRNPIHILDQDENLTT